MSLVSWIFQNLGISLEPERIESWIKTTFRAFKIHIINYANISSCRIVVVEDRAKRCCDLPISIANIGANGWLLRVKSVFSTVQLTSFALILSYLKLKQRALCHCQNIRMNLESQTEQVFDSPLVSTRENVSVPQSASEHHKGSIAVVLVAFFMLPAALWLCLLRDWPLKHWSLSVWNEGWNIPFSHIMQTHNTNTQVFKYTCVHTHNSGIDFLSPRTPQVSPWFGRWRPLEMMIVPKATWRFSLRSSSEVQSSICKKSIKKRTKFKRWQKSPQATLRPSKLMLMLLACGFEYAKRIYASKWRLQMAPFLCVAEHPTSLSCLWFL